MRVPFSTGSWKATAVHSCPVNWMRCTSRSEYLVYQISIEDGAVFAVVLWIVETFLEVEVLLAMELLIIGGVWESHLYESQDAVGCFLFAEVPVPVPMICFTTSSRRLLSTTDAATVGISMIGYSSSSGMMPVGTSPCRGDARSFVSERLGFVANYGLAGESQSHVLAVLRLLGSSQERKEPSSSTFG